MRKKDQPYLELGETFIAWREGRHRSALAFYNSSKFTFSYSAYADFERGVALPTIETTLEIAACHGVDAQDAAMAWAKCQMPTPQLKAAFATRARKRAANDVTPADSRQAEATAPSMENTWVFSLGDQAAFKKSPWLADLLMRLVRQYPDALDYKELGFKTPAGFQKFKTAHLKPWIEQGNVLDGKEGLKLARPHYYFPKSKDWQELRKALFLRATERVSGRIDAKELELGDALRALESRTLSKAQRQRWVKRIQGLVTEFLADPYERSPEPHAVMSLAIALGERPLDIPADILKKYTK